MPELSDAKVERQEGKAKDGEGGVTVNHRKDLLDGLWSRLGRHARGTWSQRSFLVDQITHILSCTFLTERLGG